MLRNTNHLPVEKIILGRQKGHARPLREVYFCFPASNGREVKGELIRLGLVDDETQIQQENGGRGKIAINTDRLRERFENIKGVIADKLISEGDLETARLYSIMSRMFFGTRANISEIGLKDVLEITNLRILGNKVSSRFSFAAKGVSLGLAIVPTCDAVRGANEQVLQNWKEQPVGTAIITAALFIVAAVCRFVFDKKIKAKGEMLGDERVFLEREITRRSAQLEGGERSI